MSAAERCARVRELAGAIRAELKALRGLLPAEELDEARLHLLEVTAAVNRAETVARPPVVRASDLESVKAIFFGKMAAANDHTQEATA